MGYTEARQFFLFTCLVSSSSRYRDVRRLSFVSQTGNLRCRSARPTDVREATRAALFETIIGVSNISFAMALTNRAIGGE
jgi:hypothetical protein